MKKFPPEIDRLMWAVAENPSPQALDEFATRYPDYRTELLKRVEMVRGIRQEVKGAGFQKREIPKFEPRPVQPPGAPRGAMVAATFALVALAFAGFTAITARKPVKPTPLPEKSFVQAPLPIPPIVVNNGIARPHPPIQAPPPVQTSPEPPPKTTTVALEDKKRDLSLKGVDLVDGLSLVTSGTHIKLEIAPGFVNQKVSLDFHDKTTWEMLSQMAKDYAFTVSDEGGGQVLVVPQADSAPEEESSPNNQKRIGP